VFPARSTEWWQVAALGGVSLILLALVSAIRFLVPTPLAPQVKVRWVAGLSDATRAELEQRFELFAGKQGEGATWTYDLADDSPSNIRALIDHQAVEDTHDIDRPRAAVAPDAPRGTTMVVRSWIAAWRESIALEWIGLLCFWAVAVSGFWLASSRR
jgi:hypothetical protein